MTAKARIFEAALYSGWYVKPGSQDETGVIFQKDDDEVYVCWTRADAVLQATVWRNDPDRTRLVEFIGGKGKAGRVESILWSAASIPATAAE